MHWRQGARSCGLQSVASSGCWLLASEKLSALLRTSQNAPLFTVKSKLLYHLVTLAIYYCQRAARTDLLTMRVGPSADLLEYALPCGTSHILLHLEFCCLLCDLTELLLTGQHVSVLKKGRVAKVLHVCQLCKGKRQA